MTGFGMSKETARRLWENPQDAEWDWYDYVLNETLRINRKENEHEH